jgi:hypothetical protein
VRRGGENILLAARKFLFYFFHPSLFWGSTEHTEFPASREDG